MRRTTDRCCGSGGATSAYVADDYAPAMEKLFPRVRRVTIKGAGHWVHSEQPDVFVEVLRRPVRPGPESGLLARAVGRDRLAVAARRRAVAT